MAGDWIKMRSDLHTHPKVVRIASALNADRLRVIGALHATWCLFDAHSVDGSLDGYSSKTLDDMIDFPGFSRAMIAVGWLEECETSLCMPRFFEHNGQGAKRRAQEAERKRNIRKTSASDADKKRTREEERREEVKDKTPLVARDENLAVRGNTDPPDQAKSLAGHNEPIGVFVMHSDWQPSLDFRQRAATWGVILPDPAYLPTELAEFVDYWQPTGKAHHQTQWEQKLARHVQRARIAKPAAPPGRQALDWDNTDWIDPIAGQIPIGGNS
ncbi:Pyocin large subunit [Dickeya dadantii]|uniref:DnaT-like ssDNA-binding domain-containing protein n=1 Tax=Dickeya dadantii TaxID=204038 RepID=UPI001495AB2B|nr:DnaT-like ssDNA-binding domain-containing protein [Dickeya dadantii]NPE57701.1 Pyocin large subunit [Dickeya dadantii]NPE69824.1 Pyocin large subunit [Dickeya dadantii]